MKFRIQNWKALLSLAGLLCVPGVNLCASTLGATATFTDTEVSPGMFEYDLTLNNTGTTDIGTFWFAWIPGANFLTVAPTDIVSPAGWTPTIINSGGFSILWQDTGALGQGTSQSGFSFQSTLTPADLEGPSSIPGDPVATSFVYIGAPFDDPGLQFVPTPAQTSTTPEPGTMLLTALGIGLAVFSRRAFRRA